jgi:hypothetical protein
MKHRLYCRYYDVLYACAFPRNKWCSIRHSHSPYACLFDWFVVYVVFYLKTGRIQKLSRFSSKNYDRVVVTRDILETSSLTSGFCWVFFRFVLFVCVCVWFYRKDRVACWCSVNQLFVLLCYLSIRMVVFLNYFQSPSIGNRAGLRRCGATLFSVTPVVSYCVYLDSQE